jgi:hypothetical protein
MLSPIERPAQQTLSGGAFFLIGTRDKGQGTRALSAPSHVQCAPTLVPRPSSLTFCPSSPVPRPKFQHHEELHPNSRSPSLDRLPPNDPASDRSAIAPRPTHVERPAAGIAPRHATAAQTQQALPSVLGPPQLPHTDESQAQSAAVMHSAMHKEPRWAERRSGVLWFGT